MDRRDVGRNAHNRPNGKPRRGADASAQNRGTQASGAPVRSTASHCGNSSRYNAGGFPGDGKGKPRGVSVVASGSVREQGSASPGVGEGGAGRCVPKGGRSFPGSRDVPPRGASAKSAGPSSAPGTRAAAAGTSGAPRAAEGRSARDVALTALRDVTRNGAYASQALDRALRGVPLSDADRRLAAGIFYFALENRLRIETCIMTRFRTPPEPAVMDVLCIALAQILYMDRVPDYAAVDEAVKQLRRSHRESSTAMANAVLRGLIRDRDEGKLTLPDREADPPGYLSQKYSVALPLARRLLDAFGLAEAERLLSRNPGRRIQTVRPNRLRLSDAEFEDWLKENRLQWSHGIVPGAYRIANAGLLADHPGYRSGLFSIQGESSMLAALAVQPRPGMQLLDACAAPGGKSCLLAELMNGAGRVHAWDIHEHRVELIRSAARRLGLENLRPQQRDATKVNASLLGMMDAVLVDAPCSGLGVIADKPDIKYRVNEEGIAALQKIQAQLLDACAGYVCPGGLLVYSTCTILPGENGEQVDAFLDRHPEFVPDAEASWLPEVLRAHWSQGRIQILPDRDDLEGFFIVRLRRKEGSYGG